jgi:hypothetical protein
MSTEATARQGWTAEAVEALGRMASAGHSDVEIGRQLGLSPAAVGRKRRALGIASGVPSRLRIVVARRALGGGSGRT